MKRNNLKLIHAINLFFLAVLIAATALIFINPDGENVSPFNPVILGIMIFLYIYWGGNYMMQIKNARKQWLILLSSALFIAVLAITHLLMLPRVYDTYAAAFITNLPL